MACHSEIIFQEKRTRHMYIFLLLSSFCYLKDKRKREVLFKRLTGSVVHHLSTSVKNKVGVYQVALNLTLVFKEFIRRQVF